MATAAKQFDFVLPVPEASADLEMNKRNLDEYGVCIHKGLLDATQVQAIIDRLDEQAELERNHGVALVAGQSRTGRTTFGGLIDGNLPPWQGVSMLPNKGREFIDLMTNGTLVEYAAHVFKNYPFHLSSMTGLIIRAGSEPMVVHNDQQFMPFPTPTPLGINCMVCLTDFTEEMGATKVVPGSHRAQRSPEMAVSDDRGNYNPVDYETFSAECRAGDVIIFESRTWHQSGASRSSNTRMSVSVNYCQSWAKPIDNLVASLHQDVFESLSLDERAMLGFRIDGPGRFEPRYATETERQAVNRRVPFVPMMEKGGAQHAKPLDEMYDYRPYKKGQDSRVGIQGTDTK